MSNRIPTSAVSIWLALLLLDIWLIFQTSFFGNLDIGNFTYPDIDDVMSQLLDACENRKFDLVARLFILFRFFKLIIFCPILLLFDATEEKNISAIYCLK